MATTTFNIPVVGGTVTARNKREERAARHFLIKIDVAVSICRDEMADGYNTEAHDALHRRAMEIAGFAQALLWEGMLDKAEYHDTCIGYSSIFAGKVIDYIRGEACDECA